MEKYSVDYESDDIELRANELVKLGGLTDITEARFAAQKEKEGSNGTMEQLRSTEDLRSADGGIG